MEHSTSISWHAQSEEYHIAYCRDPFLLKQWSMRRGKARPFLPYQMPVDGNLWQCKRKWRWVERQFACLQVFLLSGWKTVQRIGKDEGRKTERPWQEGSGQKIQTEKCPAVKEKGFWYIFDKTVFRSFIDMWMFLVRHPIWIWIFYLWSTFMVVTEDILHIPCRYQANLTQDISTIPSKRMDLAYFQEYFRDFCWIVLAGLYRDTYAWKAICSARLCWGREEALLWISHLFYIKCDLISFESFLIILLPCHTWQQWHSSLADSTTNEQLSLMAPISLVRFCFLLF